MLNQLADLTWLTSGPFTGPLWGGLAAVAGVFFGTSLFMLWLWMLVEAYNNKKLDSIWRIIWFLLIFFTVFGALVYFLIYMPKLNRKSVWFKISIGIVIVACLPTLFLVLGSAFS